MPFVQVHTSRDVSPAVRRSLGFALANAYGEHMRTSRRIVNVGFVHYAEGELVRYDAANDEPQAMTIVTCEVRTGRSPEMLESLGRAITEACSRSSACRRRGSPSTSASISRRRSFGTEVAHPIGRPRSAARRRTL
jgi:hypothetical protein